jgi:hypothetical protein
MQPLQQGGGFKTFQQVHAGCPKGLWEQGLQGLEQSPSTPCTSATLSLLNSECFAATPHQLPLTAISIEALCVQTICHQGLGTAVTWRSPDVAPSSRHTRPGAFVYILALATNSVLSEASWESCVPFSLAERDPR